MGILQDYLAPIKKVTGFFEIIKVIGPPLSVLFGPSSAIFRIIPIESSLRAPAGGLALILSLFAFLFVFPKDRSKAGGLICIFAGIACFGVYWALRFYFGRNPPFISQGVTEFIMIILYALFFAFITAAFTSLAFKLDLAGQRSSESRKGR